MKIVASIILAVLAINSCNDSKEDTSKTVTYYVNSTKVSCEGVGQMQCLQIKKGESMADSDWINFYGKINGFDHQQGYTYKLSVNEEKLDPSTVPADASSIRYTLVEVLEKKQDPTFRLHDIWSLQSLNGMSLESDRYAKPAKTPRLELFVAEKRIGGTDGCNNFFGSIEKMSETELSFSKLGASRMMCPNMEVPNAFTEALRNTSSYTIKNLHLSLFNAEGAELLKLVKVD